MPAEVDIEIPTNGELASGDRSHASFYRPFEPVPVPDGDQNTDREYQYSHYPCPTWRAGKNRMRIARAHYSLNVSSPGGFRRESAGMCYASGRSRAARSPRTEQASAAM